MCCIQTVIITLFVQIFLCSADFVSILTYIFGWFSQSPCLHTQEAEFVKQASEAWEEAIKIAESTTGWKEEKNDKKTGDIVESRKNEKGKKIYR